MPEGFVFWDGEKYVNLDETPIFQGAWRNMSSFFDGGPHLHFDLSNGASPFAAGSAGTHVHPEQEEFERSRDPLWNVYDAGDPPIDSEALTPSPQEGDVYVITSVQRRASGDVGLDIFR